MPMPGEVKDSGKWKIPAVDSLILEKGNSENNPMLAQDGCLKLM